MDLVEIDVGAVVARDEGKELDGARFADEGGHVKPADLLGHDHVVGAGQHQFALGFRHDGAADDIEARVELPGRQHQEEVFRIVGQGGDQGPGPVDAGAHERVVVGSVVFDVQ